MGDGFGDRRIRMPQDDRAPRANVIQQLVAVRVVEVLPVGVIDHQRVATDRAERAHGTVHAADEYLLGALEDFTRALAFAL